MKLFYWGLLIIGMMFSCTSCKDDDSLSEIKNPSPLEQWSATWKGDGETLAAYPDLFVNYWEYTYQVDQYPDVALRITGSFPHARFFSFTLYDDETGGAIGGIDDYKIEPEAGSDNPFLTTSSKDNKFTIYVVPSTMDAAQLAKLPSKNICMIEKGVKRAAVCIRQYLGTDANGEKDEYGGVELPAVEAVDINSLKEVPAPLRTKSNIDNFPVNYEPQAADSNRDMPFFLASKGAYYPNFSTDYLYARTILSADSVLIFSFIPVSIPKTKEENVGANARYWSICLGSALNTRSYYSVYDTESHVKDGEKCNFIICLKQNPQKDKIQAKVNSLKAKSQNWQLMVWDSEKLDLDNKPIGNTIVTMYRQILPNINWQYSIARMTVTPYGNPVDHVTDPNKQLAHKALGEYGPYGFKYMTDEFLDDDFKPMAY